MADLRQDEAFAALMAESFQRLTGRALAAEVSAAGLYGAPFCLLAHDGGADPVFIYANRATQGCFGYGWAEFLRLPSRLSAEAPERAERARLLEAVRTKGFIADYKGVRVRKDGGRFVIEQAVVWELRDTSGARHGQAAVFGAWRDL